MKFQKMLFFVLFFATRVLSEPLLVVVLMVKNEATVIVQTLQPFVDGGVKDFIIFDTGSTDGTQEIAKEFFSQHSNCNTHIIQEPFVDFSTSRNRALDEAERIFPQATFMLMPDAEWYMHNVDGLLKFCNDHKDYCYDSYFVPIQSITTTNYIARLIQCHKNIRFVGAVHEVLNKLTAAKLPDNIYFEWRPSKKGTEKSAARWQRDRDLLLKSYAQNPLDPRTLFYLAQTYECLGDWENAYTFYTKRAAIQGWDQEDFITWIRLGDVAQKLFSQDDGNVCPRAIQHYLKAFALRPHRAESLIKIAQYYMDKGKMYLAFLFATRAIKIPYPTNDILFVEKFMYDFVRYDILGVCAWYVGEYEIGKWAIMQALKVNHDVSRLNSNLKYYTGML